MKKMKLSSNSARLGTDLMSVIFGMFPPEVINYKYKAQKREKH